MSLGEFSAAKKAQIYEALKSGQNPSEGDFDGSTLAEARRKGVPQMGATHYDPTSIHLEYIFPSQAAGTTVFTVRVEAPERIVFLPVPRWVVESIWQGDITGSYHFESDAMKMLEEFQSRLAPAENAAHFDDKARVGRES